MSLWKIFSRGIIEENPYFVLALSLCPGLAVTTSVINGLTMGLTVGSLLLVTTQSFLLFVRRLIKRFVYLYTSLVSQQSLLVYSCSSKPLLPICIRRWGYILTWLSYSQSSWLVPNRLLLKTALSYLSSTAWAWDSALQQQCSSFPSFVKFSATVRSSAFLFSEIGINRL